MSAYTPTTATIRAEYAGRVEAWEMTYAEQEAARAEEVVEFDRWLAAHDAQVAAQALREAADEMEAMLGEHGPGNRNTGYGQAGLALLARIRDRADRIERGE